MNPSALRALSVSLRLTVSSGAGENASRDAGFFCYLRSLVRRYHNCGSQEPPGGPGSYGRRSSTGLAQGLLRVGWSLRDDDFPPAKEPRVERESAWAEANDRGSDSSRQSCRHPVLQKGGRGSWKPRKHAGDAKDRRHARGKSGKTAREEQRARADHHEPDSQHG